MHDMMVRMLSMELEILVVYSLLVCLMNMEHVVLVTDRHTIDVIDKQALNENMFLLGANKFWLVDRILDDHKFLVVGMMEQDVGKQVDGMLVLLDGMLVLLDGKLVPVDGKLLLVDGKLVLVDGMLVLVDGTLALVDDMMAQVVVQNMILVVDRFDILVMVHRLIDQNQLRMRMVVQMHYDKNSFVVVAHHLQLNTAYFAYHLDLQHS